MLPVLPIRLIFFIPPPKWQSGAKIIIPRAAGNNDFELTKKSPRGGNFIFIRRGAQNFAAAQRFYAMKVNARRITTPANRVPSKRSKIPP